MEENKLENKNVEDTIPDLKQDNKDEQKREETTENPQSPPSKEDQEKEILLKKIEEMTQQLSELNDKYIRLLAEFDNFKKRSRKEREILLKYNGEEAWKSILPILDDFERAIKENENANDIQVVKEGFRIIYNKLKHIISQNKILPIDSMHKEFNPDIMEAIAKIPAPSEDMKGKVVEELEKAYMYDDKLIRYAKVVLAE